MLFFYKLTSVSGEGSQVHTMMIQVRHQAPPSWFLQHHWSTTWTNGNDAAVVIYCATYLI